MNFDAAGNLWFVLLRVGVRVFPVSSFVESADDWHHKRTVSDVFSNSLAGGVKLDVY